MIEHICWQIIWQIEDRVIVVDVDAADKFGFDIRLIGNRANDIAWFNTMFVADSNAVSLHTRFRSTWAMFATDTAVFTFKTITTVTAWAVTAITAITSFAAIITCRALITPAIIGLHFFAIFIQQQRFVAARHFS